MREMIITYCNYCKKEIEGNYHTLYTKDGGEKHFHNSFKKGEKENCLIKYKKKKQDCKNINMWVSKINKSKY